VRRYTDDCHYTGGAVNAVDLLAWATSMLAYDARPPDPAVVGDIWREEWLRRLHDVTPMIEPWLTHQLEDDYWRHGSVAFDPGALDVPILAVGGWADPYRNAVLDLMAMRPDLVHGLIGPWSHGYPHATAPGPMIDFLGECARFFGEHLRGDPAIAKPPLRVFVQDADPPRSPVRSGRWLGVERVGEQSLMLPLVAGPVPIRPDVGATAGTWCPYSEATVDTEQSVDDAGSLVTDLEIGAEGLAILGFPVARITVTSDRPHAVVAVRLCDVAPDGTSLLVTRGILDLTHRLGHDRAVAMPLGEPVEVSLRLDAAGHRFLPGHRLRVAISSAYWPWIWPVPELAALKITDAEISLPRLDERGAQPVDLGSPKMGASARIEVLSVEPGRPDFLLGRVRYVDSGIEAAETGSDRHGSADEPTIGAFRRCELSRPAIGWSIAVEADAVMTERNGAFRVVSVLRAWEGDDLVAERRHEVSVARPALEPA
jgi:uncharacterized protein